MEYRLFPELTPDALKTVLRNDARVDTGDQLSLETAEALEELGLIRLSLREYTRCVNDVDPDYHQLSPEQRLCDGEIDVQQDVCPVCGRQVEDQSAKQRFGVVYIRFLPQGIAEYVEDALRHIPAVRSVDRAGENSVSANLDNGRTLRVILLNPAAGLRERYGGIYFGGAHLFVYYAIYEKPLTNLLNENAVIWLGDFLSCPERYVRERLLLATAPSQVADRITLEECDQQFTAYVDRTSWQDFEKRFVPRLLDRIMQGPQKLQDYLHDLQALDNSILGAFPVSIGGAGQTDIRLISKYEIMSAVFHPNNIGDAKRYSAASTVTSDDVRDVLNHLNQIPQVNQGSAIIFASTDEVQSGAWANICRYRDVHGYWQIVILPKYLILELLAVFDALDLIQ